MVDGLFDELARVDTLGARTRCLDGRVVGGRCRFGHIEVAANIGARHGDQVLRHALSNGYGRRSVAHDHAVEPYDLLVSKWAGEEPIAHAAFIVDFVSGVTKCRYRGIDAAACRRDGHAGGVVGMGEELDQLVGKQRFVLAGVLAQELQDAHGAIGCHRGGAPGRGLVVFNNGFGHGAHVLSFFGDGRSEPRARSLAKDTWRLGRSMVAGKRRVEFSTTLPN